MHLRGMMHVQTSGCGQAGQAVDMISNMHSQGQLAETTALVCLLPGLHAQCCAACTSKLALADRSLPGFYEHEQTNRAVKTQTQLPAT